jgi:hypothetical protein
MTGRRAVRINLAFLALLVFLRPWDMGATSFDGWKKKQAFGYAKGRGGPNAWGEITEFCPNKGQVPGAA